MHSFFFLQNMGMHSGTYALLLICFFSLELEEYVRQFLQLAKSVRFQSSPISFLICNQINKNIDQLY
jgi:hypothetical protein